jgi:hypothetical protein
MYISGLFIDISKAFDSISHKILLDKLYQYGFRGLAHSWFQSYLSHRYQFVSSSSNASSSLLSITSGVPQGSILGPVLFLVYINDLSKISNKTRFILFADDTTCLFTSPKNVDFQQLVNTECLKISRWFLCNCLSLNITKCKFIQFGLKKNCIDDFVLQLNNNRVERVDSVKFLGCYIDSCLNWHEHINYVCTRISKGIAMLRFVNKVFSVYAKKMLYFAYIFPWMSYLFTSVGWESYYLY